MTSATAGPLERLKAVVAQIEDLHSVEQVLDWDQQVWMPPAGASARADAFATVTKIAHELLVDDTVGELLEELAPLEDELGSDSVDGALIRVTRYDWERARRVPTELSAEMSHAAGVGVAAWQQARAQSDFSVFAPHLERQLELKRRYVECFPEAAAPYDVLLEDYEQGMTTAAVADVFGRVREALVPLVDELRNRSAENGVLGGPFPVERQKVLCRGILDAFGGGSEAWRLDETAHPFASAPGVGDVRLTTAYRPADLNALFSTMHEFGHGIYEACVDPALARTPLGSGTSSAVHESQSRTWENLVGRSRGFWRWFAPQLRDAFPESLAAVDDDAIYAAVNAVRPGLIRIDADEVTYPLHIILRFELEQRLLAGEVAAGDAPEAWNALIREYLGLDVPDDAHGVLQDIHWSVGLIGYFPTYQLGNVMSLQIWSRAQAELGDLEEQFARGEFAPLREWLRDNVYRHGRMYPPRELLRRVTGNDLDPEPYLEYLQAKYGT